MVNTNCRLRIALLARQFVPSLGGLESWVHDLAIALAGRGHVVRVLTSEASLYPPGVDITLVPASSSILHQAHLFETAARQFGDHIIHDTGAGLGADVFQPQMGCRVLNLQRDNSQQALAERFHRAISRTHRRRRRTTLQLESAQLAAAKCVVAVSRETATTFEHRFGVPAARIHLIPNGVDTQVFHPDQCQPLRQSTREGFSLPHQALVLLAAAGNFQLKGVHHAIAALARIRAQCPEVVLLVAGQGDIAEFSAIAQRHGVAAYVRFLGHCANMPALFAAADVFVHLTAHDACSLATLEAMACGLPVITTRQNGAADGITNEQEGYVLDQPDTASLAARLLTLRDPARREAMGNAARRLAERHDFAASVDKLEELYATLARPAAEMSG